MNGMVSARIELATFYCVGGRRFKPTTSNHFTGPIIIIFVHLERSWTSFAANPVEVNEGATCEYRTL